MKNQLLLLEDVEPTGRKGEIVTVKSGFARNFLVPQKKAVIADKTTVKLQEQLKADREKQTAVDRETSVKLADQLAEMVIKIESKVDPDGKMYGSVTTLDIARLLKENGVELERKNVVLPHPIRTLGLHTIPLKLKEGVSAMFKLEVSPEGGVLPKKREAPKVQEPQEESETDQKTQEA